MNNWKDLDPAYFYGRISTDTQDRTLSIGEQRKNAEVIAQREGYKFIRDFPEVKSAATDDRPSSRK